MERTGGTRRGTEGNAEVERGGGTGICANVAAEGCTTRKDLGGGGARQSGRRHQRQDKAHADEKKTLPCRQGFLRSSYRRGASGWHRKPVLTAA